jgi:hypothetical protein
VSDDASRQIVNLYFDALNRRDYPAIHELIARPILARNIQMQQEQIGTILSDVRYRIESTVAEGNEVWAFCTLHGTHTGELQMPFATFAPTNRAIVMEQMYRFRLDGNKIDLVADLTDVLGLVTQIAG